MQFSGYRYLLGVFSQNLFPLCLQQINVNFIIGISERACRIGIACERPKTAAQLLVVIDDDL